jgi:hypothetical protein
MANPFAPRGKKTQVNLALDAFESEAADKLIIRWKIEGGRAGLMRFALQRLWDSTFPDKSS